MEGGRGVSEGSHSDLHGRGSVTAWIVLPSVFELEPEIETAIPVSSIVSVEYDWDNAKGRGSLIYLGSGPPP